MTFDTAYFHDVTFYVLYGCIALLTFVLIERTLYYALINFSAWRLGAGLRRAQRNETTMNIRGRGLLPRALSEYIGEQERPGFSRSRIEDLSGVLFLRFNGKVNTRLWILDTIVTAAPLLGLIGTILGIMDTFNALSSGGISDPSAVSRGIGAALSATAIGIGTALYGLLAHNMLHRQAEVLTESFKSLLLSLTR